MNTKKQLDRPAIVALVTSSLKATLMVSEKGQVGEINEATQLIGQSGVLDSLGLVTFALDLEKQLANDYGNWLVLADEHEMIRRDSPFFSVGTLADHILGLLESVE